MFKSKSRLPVAAMVAVVMGMLSGGAAAASAAPAVFSATGTQVFKITGLQVSWGPGANQTLFCPDAFVIYDGANSGSPLQGSLDGGISTQFYQETNCRFASGASGGGVLIRMLDLLRATSSGSAFSLSSTNSLSVYIGIINRGTSLPNVPFTVPWTNPNGANPAKFTFSHTHVATTSWAEPVYLTGTFTKFGAALALS